MSEEILFKRSIHRYMGKFYSSIHQLFERWGDKIERKQIVKSFQLIGFLLIEKSHKFFFFSSNAVKEAERF